MAVIPKMVRKMVGMENFFVEGYRMYGAFYVVSHWTLSRDITSEQLGEAAEKLRQKHRILQLDYYVDEKNRTFYFTEGDQLKTWIDHETRNNVDAVMKEMIDDSLKMREEGIRRGMLCWRLMLVGDENGGKEVLLGAPHHVTDGRSGGILGADLIRFLNGNEVGDVRPLGPGQMGLFGKLTKSWKAKTWFGFVKRMMSKPDLGLPLAGTPESWDKKSRISVRKDYKFGDLHNFHAKCKKTGVSLNSGFVSALYEVLAKIGFENKNSNRLYTMIAMDARTRVEPGKEVTKQTVGSYVGGAEPALSPRAGMWAERARDIQRSVNGDVKQNMVHDPYVLGKLAKYSKYALSGVVKDPKTHGRLNMVAVSNLGRLQEIDKANAEVSTRENAITMDKFTFGDNEQSMGWLIAMYISTVGDNVSINFSSEAPLLKLSTLEQVSDDFASTITA